MAQKRVVVLGGGISGLAAAWRLAKKAPKDKLFVTLLEASPRAGGWLKTSPVPGVGIFECGPRSLRPTGLPGLSTLSLIDQLQLTDKIYAVDQQEPASKIRSIYYNGELHQLPTNISGILTNKSPILEGLVAGLLKEPFVKSRLGVEEDESIHDFVSRRFGPKVALNLVSGIIHGIYAGDSSKLSIKSTFSSLYELERETGSIVKTMVKRMLKRGESASAAIIKKELAELNPRLHQVYEKCSMYSLYGGIEELSIRLKEELQKLPNVQVCLDSPATKLDFGETVKVHVNSQTNSNVLEADHVICAIPSTALQKLIDQPIDELTYNSSVDVAVINFAFDKKVLPYAAFGYLVPRSVKDSVALGVVFDSCSFPLATPKHEILTVMMGGHQFPSRVGNPATITNDEILFKARQVLEQQLKIRDAPVAHQVTLQHQCIPQYLVNHPKRMQKLHHTIENLFKTKLSVTGSSYTGVAINDCILYSGNLVDRLLSKGILGPDPSPSHVTGLELYKTLV